MQPVFHKPLTAWLNAGALALGDFVLMMRKHQILTAEMEIEAGSEQFHAHAAALNVPAGPAFAPRAGPEYLAIVGGPRFPERKIRHRFLFILITPHPLAHAHLFEIQLNQLAILTSACAIFFDAEIDRAIRRFVRQPA